LQRCFIMMTPDCYRMRCASFVAGGNFFCFF
jgi:hypothetical protein